MLKVKSVSEAGRKFASRIAVAGPDYKRGIEKTDDQAEKAIAAEDSWVAAMNDAIARGARVKGLTEAGTKKWKEKTLKVGLSRWPQGARAGQPDYEKKVAPYLEVISGLTLSPRGPKGSPENYSRSREVGEALHNKKIGA